MLQDSLSPDQQGKRCLFRTSDEHFVWLYLTLEEIIVITDAKFLIKQYMYIYTLTYVL